MSRPGDWLEPLYTAEEMRALDRWAIEERGVPSLELMERAGVGVAEAVRELEPTTVVRIVCGRGNNGGDGLVAARRLLELGIEVEALLLFEPDQLSPDAKANFDELRSAGLEPLRVEVASLSDALEGSGVVVDALLGTGSSGVPRAPVDRAIEAINAAAADVVAVDVPSGVDASTGEVAGDCVCADLTVTFHASKLGLWVLPAKSCCGHVEVIDIGIPDGAPVAPGAGLIEQAVLDLVPHRDLYSTKFSSGSALIVGGSVGMTGAVCLSSEAAMRAGAGWLRAAVPSSLNVIFEQKLTEAMTIPVDDAGGRVGDGAVDEVLAAAERSDAVVLGPGIGRAPDTTSFVRRVARELDRPLLVDADGLNALAGALEAVIERRHPTVLTPHAGELARLLGVTSADVSRRRLAHAREATQRTGATVVLKGDDSIVVDPDGRLAISAGASPALATAGTGDVLSGVIAAFLAKRLAAFEATCAGVYAHAQAGWIAGAEHGADCVIATDVIDALPAALRRPSDPEPATT